MASVRQRPPFENRGSGTTSKPECELDASNMCDEAPVSINLPKIAFDHGFAHPNF